MILVFGVFAFARVLVMQFLGFGLAVAVLLDATIIRMVLVPAIMHLAGRWNWWPGVRQGGARNRIVTAPPLSALRPASCPPRRHPPPAGPAARRALHVPLRPAPLTAPPPRGRLEHQLVVHLQQEPVREARPPPVLVDVAPSRS